MLSAMSCTPTCQPDYRKPSDTNRARRFPIIALPEQRFFVPDCWALAQELFEWVQEVLKERGHTTLLSRFLARRDDATEECVRSVMARLYGAEGVHGPLTYRIDETQYELDALVAVGGCAVFVEAKAHRVTDPARRGASKRIAKKASELLDAPFEQSARALEYSTGENAAFSRENRGSITVPADALRIRFAVSFERADPLSSLGPALLEPGAPYSPTWLVSLADLMAIADYLDDPAAFLSYARLRSMYAADARLLPFMEVDFLGLFALDHMRGWQTASSSVVDPLMLGYHAGDVNAYFTALDMGLQVKRPELGVPDVVRQSLKTLLTEDNPAWASAGLLVMAQHPDEWGTVSERVIGAARGLCRLSQSDCTKVHEFTDPQFRFNYICTTSGEPADLIQTEDSPAVPTIYIAENIGQDVSRNAVAVDLPFEKG